MILVTGASGLLGRAVVARLSHANGDVGALRGADLFAQVVSQFERRTGSKSIPQAQTETLPFAHAPAASLKAISSRRYEHMTGDLLDPAFCRAALSGVRVVIHAAARQHHSRPPRFGRRAFFQANVRITENLLAGAREGVERFVLVSSDMVYGMPPGVALRENHAPRPIGPYGASKLACEQALFAAAGSFSRAVLRPRLIIGPGRLGILTRLFERIARGAAVPIFGSGRNRYQMIAVEDAAEACVLAARARCDGVFNLGSDNPPTVRDLLTTLIRQAGSRSRLIAVPNAALVALLSVLDRLRIAPLVPEQFRIAGTDYVLDTSRAKTKLGWRPTASDADMLLAAYRHWTTRR